MAPTSLQALVRTRFFPLIFVAALLPLAAVVVWFYMMSFDAIEEVLGQQTGRRAQTTAAAAARVYAHLLDDTALLTRGREIGRFFAALEAAGPAAARRRSRGSAPARRARAASSRARSQSAFRNEHTTRQ